MKRGLELCRDFITGGFREVLRRPPTDNWSRGHVVLWSVAAAAAASAIAVNIAQGSELLFFLNAAFLVLDLVALRWALVGLKYRRDIRNRRKAISASLAGMISRRGE